ncbi:5-formyltetrahydrofolate cyclo-ligase [Vibrio sp. SCSIO 43137]|uniref:5-formyltetrahydrofolate cyclo-ligase n=1 Tax=Vibrio sp. SCSIO 43137 TaxID=3021011 RepID=UPI0023077109|nr:5-formyltetrahydrofolate cyclo-ligase [Vibrio sp. SCSIO 43137]WCE30154.1 5-formyltetrahydrofolate cyclo-ligase [Vibrio sp. SCSIO 43137]
MQDLRSTIRKQVRSKRQNLSSLNQTIAAEDALSQVKNFSLLAQAENIAIYLSADGELDTHPIIEWLWQAGKKVYLPVLHPFSKGHLLFIRYEADTPMTENRFNIQEPQLNVCKVIPLSELDIIFTPLVAFDNSGQRMGMGGGYYDRSLERWYQTGFGAVPVGLGHDCQQIDEVPSEDWDVPLPYIITPSKTWQWEIPH